MLRRPAVRFRRAEKAAKVSDLAAKPADLELTIFKFEGYRRGARSSGYGGFIWTHPDGLIWLQLGDG